MFTFKIKGYSAVVAHSYHRKAEKGQARIEGSRDEPEAKQGATRWTSTARTPRPQALAAGRSPPPPPPPPLVVSPPPPPPPCAGT
eukprot:COSAG02_NODE_20118_length_847_cov_16.069519_1_plen_84_part_01